MIRKLTALTAAALLPLIVAASCANPGSGQRPAPTTKSNEEGSFPLNPNISFLWHTIPDIPVDWQPVDVVRAAAEASMMNAGGTGYPGFQKFSQSVGRWNEIPIDQLGAGTLEFVIMEFHQTPTPDGERFTATICRSLNAFYKG